MNKLKIVGLMFKEKKYRWRYLYLTFYACGCRDLPYSLAKLIKKSNISELEDKGLLPVILDTYDGSGQAVHPDILYKDSKIWMVCTPYPYSIESYENPCIYTGDTIYGLRPVVKGPISYQENRKKGNHISDPCIFENDSQLCIVYRDTININGAITQKLYLASSSDGYNWEHNSLLMESDDKSYISPAVLNYKEKFIMFYIQLGDSPNGGDIHRVDMDRDFHVENDTVVSCRNLPDNMVVWHIGLTFDYNNSKCYKISDQNNPEGITGVFVLRDKDDNTKYALYWAHCDSISSEWIIQDLIKIPDYIQKNMKNIYKSALIPTTGEILISYNDNDYRWNFGIIPGKTSKSSNTSEPLLDSYNIFSRVFRKNMTYSRFAYKHMNNPALLKNYYYQIKHESEIVGTNCFDGVTCICENMELKLAQSCDTAVVPEARGKGIFTSLILHAEEKLQKEGVVAMLGFPNNNSYHGFIKMGWKHIGNFTPWIKMLHPIDVIVNKTFRTRKVYQTNIIPRIGSDLEKYGIAKILFETKCPFDDNDFNIINKDDTIKIKRTKDYYLWKCDFNDKFYYYVLQGNATLAYFIFRVNENGRILVVDFFFSTQDPNFIKACLANFATDIKNMGNTIVFSMIKDRSVEESVLKTLGFIMGNKKIFGFPVARMIVHVFDEEKYNDVLKFDKWFVTPLDVDTIIT